MRLTRTVLIPTLVGLVAGIAGAMIVWAIQMRGAGLDAGDILTFFGGILGIGLAVAGALWIEERKRGAEIFDGAKPILDALLVLELKSRPFFYDPGSRRAHHEEIDRRMETLDRLLVISPPRAGRQILLLDRLKQGAAFLTTEVYLSMDEQAPMVPGPERHRVEELLEMFDTPLKLLIVEYSRIVNPRSPRAVRELGEFPEP